MSPRAEKFKKAKPDPTHSKPVNLRLLLGQTLLDRAYEIVQDAEQNGKLAFPSNKLTMAELRRLSDEDVVRPLFNPEGKYYASTLLECERETAALMLLEACGYKKLSGGESLSAELTRVKQALEESLQEFQSEMDSAGVTENKLYTGHVAFEVQMQRLQTHVGSLVPGHQVKY